MITLVFVRSLTIDVFHPHGPQGGTLCSEGLQHPHSLTPCASIVGRKLLSGLEPQFLLPWCIRKTVAGGEGEQHTDSPLQVPAMIHRVSVSWSSHSLGTTDLE